MDKYRFLNKLMHKFLFTPYVRLIARPYLDKLVLAISKKYFFPTSYIWSLINKSHYDYEKFTQIIIDNCNCDINEHKILNIMNKVEKRSLKADLAKENWNEYFFGSKKANNIKLQTVEEQRLRYTDSFFQSRFLLSFTIKNLDLKKIKMSIKTEEEVQKVYKQPSSQSDSLKIDSDYPEVEVSKKIDEALYTKFWIKFKSPSSKVSEYAYAIVNEPKGVKNPPTLIFGHGIFVEFDHWKTMIDETVELVKNGIRVIRPESPWHGRRVEDKKFGGFDFLDEAPLSYIKFYEAAVNEWHIMSRWAKERGCSKLAFGGSSLGAQTAQLVSLKSKSWEKEYRPEVLFLLTHCSNLSKSAEPLFKMWGINERLAKNHWNQEKLEKWAQLIEPIGDMPISSDNIISILGKTDIITPFAEGVKLLDDWKVPQSNRFYWDMGHFGVPLMLLINKEPIKLFLKRMSR